MSTFSMSDISFHITLNDLCLSQGISREAIWEIVEYEIVEPLADGSKHTLRFDTQGMFWIKKAVQLKHQLEVDWVATAVIIKLLKTQEKLERENTLLKARVDRHLLL